MADIYLTTIATSFRKHEHNYRVLFGDPDASEVLNKTHGVTDGMLHFRPGSLFGLDLWDCNKYGTTRWRVIVARTIGPGEVCHLIPQVQPGALILMDVKGAYRARAAINWLMRMQLTADILAVPDAVFEASNFFFNSMSLRKIHAGLKHD